jgi:hypothetical protein
LKAISDFANGKAGAVDYANLESAIEIGEVSPTRSKLGDGVVREVWHSNIYFPLGLN